MRVIKPEAVGSHERAGLLHMSTERFAQDGMQNMRSSMIRGDASTPIFIDVSLYLLAGHELSIFHSDLVDDHAPNGGIGINDARDSRRRCECTDITYLPAGFCVERRLIENDFGRCTSLD